MQVRRKRLSAEQQLLLLQANALDYMVLAAAGAIPLFLQGLAIQKPNVGMTFVVLYVCGLFTSYLIRRLVAPNRVFAYSGWLLFGAGAVTLVNLPTLNGMLPDGGFDPRFYIPAFLCFFLALGSFFLWSDTSMMFMTVPGVALFGILSWLETAGYFEVSLILFMASVAVLLTRLHLRAMYAYAMAAGFRDLHELHRGPWRAIAGPFLAILTILVVAGFSWFIAPLLRTAAQAAVGDRPILLTPPPIRSPSGLPLRAERIIGAGPASSSNRILFRVKSDSLVPYIRTYAYDTYRRVGWNESNMVRDVRESESSPISQIANARVYEFRLAHPLARGEEVDMYVRPEWGGSGYLPVPGPVMRLEISAPLAIDRNQFLLIPNGLPAGKEFFVRSIWQRPTAEMMRSEPSLRGAISSSILASDSIDPRVRQVAQELSRGEETPYDVIQAFMDYIADRCRYNLRADAIRGDVDRVATFLFETREGYCDLFASALAVMLRAVEIDARVAVGYRIEGAPDDNGWIAVRDRNAHMWTEVYFPKYGWIPFDVTDMASAVPGGEVGALLEEEEEHLTLSWAVRAVTFLFGAAAVILITAFIVGALRTRARILGPYRKLRPSYLKFLRLVASGVRRPKLPSETLRQYADAYSEATGNGQSVARVAEMFDRAFYSSDAPTAEQIEEVRRNVAGLAATAKNGHGENPR